MSNLPHDLVEEILSRVPTTTLKRFRSTCKRWNTLFKDQRFTKKHIDKAPKQSLALMLNDCRVSSLSLNLHEIDNNIDSPFIEFKGELTLKDSPSSSERVDIFQVFHCDGLLLCHTKNDRLVVWNPCTGETKWIKPSNRYLMFSLGYKNNKSSRNYKLLLYCHKNPNDRVVEFGIYEFSSGSWRVLNVTAKFITRPSGVSLKGNTYWISYDHKSLLSFDFSTERLGRLNLPFQVSPFSATSLTTVREEQLSVLHNVSRSSKMMEIWVTTNDKIDHTVVLSWSKLFAINPYSLFSGRLLLSCLSFLIEEEKNVAVCCGNVLIEKTVKEKLCVIGENGVHRAIEFGGAIEKRGRAMIFSYVPSLVQIQQGTIIP